MAEDVLVKEVLTDKMIEAGRALTEALEQSGSSFAAAFWLYDWENNRWKLTFAFPVDGPDAINEVLALRRVTTPQVDFFDLRVTSIKGREVREILEVAQRGYKIENRVHRGAAIEDSYVYRVRV
jgi:hypothetical protein